LIAVSVTRVVTSGTPAKIAAQLRGLVDVFRREALDERVEIVGIGRHHDSVYYSAGFRHPAHHLTDEAIFVPVLWNVL
jgi:hypothetical protein